MYTFCRNPNNASLPTTDSLRAGFFSEDFSLRSALIGLICWKLAVTRSFWALPTSNPTTLGSLPALPYTPNSELLTCPLSLAFASMRYLKVRPDDLSLSVSIWKLKSTFCALLD